MPSISSAGALRSSGSSVSSCSDFSVDGNVSEGGYLERSSTDNSVECYTTSSRKQMDDLILPGKAKQEIGGVSRSSENTERDEIHDNVQDNLDRHSSLPVGGSKVFLTDDEVDVAVWLPPKPQNEEDDIMGSVANYDDDDDECVDGVAWAKTSSLSNKFEEEKLKAMDDVKNGKFKNLVIQLIKSMDIDTSGNYCENWVDIVTSLSWEAAAFVRPNAQEGTAMDPDGHVKLKCIATGSRNKSRVVKGLVFKKHAAHKHMQTMYKNPRLLLINGSLDLSSAGLSSFNSMQQEKDNQKAIVEMIDKYHPNVILVEKSVARDILESILAKGVTLIFDMKLHRLERVTRCIGSPISLSEVTSGQKLQQCEAFRIEKFVEEHDASAEGGKKPSKTLMFLEGSPNRLGCTILLMGAKSNELKRIKCAVRCAVVMAYHLMLETSFLLDQSKMLSTISPGEVVDLALTNNQSTSDEATLSGTKKSVDQSSNLDTTISNTLQETGSLSQISISEEDSSFPFVPYTTESFPGLTLSTSIKKVIDDSFPPGSECSPSISALGFSGTNDDGYLTNAITICEAEEIVDSNNRKSSFVSEGENSINIEQTYTPESQDMQNQSDSTEEQNQYKDEIKSVLESESILVLMSTRNASRGTVCEQSHFSHIMFYRNLDVPLGKFLRDNLLRQTRQCKTCNESPKEHIFYYAHHNKQLSIQVKSLPIGRSLPGEMGGKLWMWGRCGKCKLDDGNSKSSKRILLSSDASGLSFGKFLELSFSNQPSFSSLSSCGHSFDKDFLYFFGSGPMVALFTYSSVSTHSVSLPSQKMEFNSSIRGEFIKRDYEEVQQKGTLMFREIEDYLKRLETRYVGVTLIIMGTMKNFSDIVDSLQDEKSQFQVSIQNAFENANEEEVAGKLLVLNRIRMELMLESCIWDQRLHALRTSDFKVVNIKSSENTSEIVEDVQKTEHFRNHDGIVEDDETVNSEKLPEDTSEMDGKFDSLVDSGDFEVKDILIQGEGFEEHNPYSTFVATEDVSSENHFEKSEIGAGQENPEPSEESRMISVATDFEEEVSEKNRSLSGKLSLSVLSDLENDKSWIWTPFSDIRNEYMEDIRRGYLPKFDTFNSYGSESMAQKLIVDEGARLHIPLVSNDFIVSDYEDEFSSIIACALTFLKDRSDELSEDSRNEKGADGKVIESSQSMIRSFSLNSPHWSSFGSSDSDGNHSPFAVSSEDSHTSSFDGLDFFDYGAGHPQVSLGFGKSHGKRKYSVITLYATQFRQLRDRCCPSEFHYISSLSRCKNWDAKGGKSNSFFAKTLDDRLIIKEIKRTEFDSFLKFASSYFEYMNQCFELGNQTCLAKILGIYQIATRATKSGKETRHDLLVMENLSFGRHIARQYDLKGALHARFTSSGDGLGDVLLDQNFVNDMNVSPLYVSRKSKRILQRAVYNDTHFLNSINVMDYSLLVGVDTHRRELVCGIIDYLRQYTWDKQLENWVKSSLVVPKNQLPTIISPKEYKKRFRKFINTHFLSVPDHWCSRRSIPCKLCGPSNENLDNGSAQ